MAGFSSQGPTDVDFRVKPDLVAPGVNVLSSIPRRLRGDGCFASRPARRWRRRTSRARPPSSRRPSDVGGRAGPVGDRQHGRRRCPSRRPHGGAAVTDVNVVGAGRLDVSAAVGATAGVSPVSTSFGAVPSGSGQVRTASVVLTNLSGCREDVRARDRRQVGSRRRVLAQPVQREPRGRRLGLGRRHDDGRQGRRRRCPGLADRRERRDPGGPLGAVRLPEVADVDPRRQ